MRICSRTWRCGILTGILVILVLTVRAFSFSDWMEHKKMGLQVADEDEDDNEYEADFDLDEDAATADEEGNIDDTYSSQNSNLGGQRVIGPANNQPKRSGEGNQKRIQDLLTKFKLKGKLRAARRQSCSGGYGPKC